jgi:inosine-uridine nucleoside N-ribohydrolase
MLTKQVLIDSDPATGEPNRDVDDGLAFLLLLASTDIQVRGITINFGNVSADRGYQVAKNLLDLAHLDIPVYKGAASKSDLGRPNPAVDYLIETVRATPGEISLLALGPLTNIATAMMLDPGFAPNLRELVVMGGSLHFKPFSIFGEFNLHLDGQAASIALSAPVQKTLITMDVCSKAVFRQEHLRMLENHDSPISRYLVKAISPWLDLNRKVFFRAQGFFPWDVVAAAYLIEKTLFDENLCSLSVQKTGLRSGRIENCQPYDPTQPGDGSLPVNIPMELDTQRFMPHFLSSLLKF